MSDVAMRDKELERKIGEAADAYQRAAEAKENASKALADLLRQAYAQQEQQSAILRAAKHVWSREYLRIVLGLNKKRGANQR
jgi:hypothetical protein